jgi:hypothetical protein
MFLCIILCLLNCLIDIFSRMSQCGIYFLFSIYINCYLTLKEKQKQTLVTFFFFDRRRQAAKVQNRKKNMKEKNMQRACNGCPIHFYPLFLSIYLSDCISDIHTYQQLSSNGKHTKSYKRFSCLLFNIFSKNEFFVLL